MDIRTVKCAFFASALALAVAAAPAMAATPTQGTLGATSQGVVGISATIPQRVQISGLSDFAFGTLDPATAASTPENVCVWSNTATKSYNITATGSGASSAFTLSNGSTTLAYGVQWAASSGATSGTPLAVNTASATFASAATTPGCSSGPSSSASLIVGFTTAQLQAATGSATAYTGSLTLLVAPQ
jgi:spore coat protein U-like protein